MSYARSPLFLAPPAAPRPPSLGAKWLALRRTCRRSRPLLNVVMVTKGRGLEPINSTAHGGLDGTGLAFRFARHATYLGVIIGPHAAPDLLRIGGAMVGSPGQLEDRIQFPRSECCGIDSTPRPCASRRCTTPGRHRR